MATSLSAGPQAFTFWPSILIVPPSVFSNPAMQRKVVVLPAPVGPNKTKNSWSWISMLRFLTAVTFLNFLVKFSNMTWAKFYPFAIPQLNWNRLGVIKSRYFDRMPKLPKMSKIKVSYLFKIIGFQNFSRLGWDPEMSCWVSSLNPTYRILSDDIILTLGSKPNSWKSTG